MEGRTVVVFGVANKRSIAWAIAQHMQQAGARLAITYQNERLKQEADDMIAALPNAEGFQCDVSSDDEIAALFDQLKAKYGKLDALVHSIAYAPAEALKNEFVQTQPRSLPHRPRHQRLLAGRAGSRRRSADDRRRQHRHHDLLRCRESRPQLQRDGSGQGRAGSLRPLPRRRSRQAQHSRQRHLRRPNQDAGRARHRQPGRDDEDPGRTLAHCSAMSM